MTEKATSVYNTKQSLISKLFHLIAHWLGNKIRKDNMIYRWHIQMDIWK